MVPSVSVVVPAYNAERSVGRAVRSLLSQTTGDVEVIAVVDGATDGTENALRTIDDGRLRIDVLQENGGVSAARNRGLDLARAPWVAFVDADDWVEPGRFAALLSATAAVDCEAVADNVYWARGAASVHAVEGAYVDESGQRKTMATLLDPDLLPRYLSVEAFVRCNLPGPTDQQWGLIRPMFRREFLISKGLRWNESAWYGEDAEFYVRCLAAGCRLWLLPDAHYYYYSDGTGVSKTAGAVAATAHQLKTNSALLEQFADRSGLRAALRTRQRRLAKALRLVTFDVERDRNGWVRAALGHPVGAVESAARFGSARARHYVSRLKADGFSAITHFVRRRSAVGREATDA